MVFDRPPTPTMPPGQGVLREAAGRPASIPVTGPNTSAT